MRRFSFTVFASMVVLALAPAGALARHHQHHAKHHRSSQRTHARARRFGDVTPTSTTPATPSDAVGSVQSFDNGVLTIALNDGSSVSGAVTNATELECEAPEQAQSSSTGEDGDGGGGNDSSGGRDSSGGGDNSGEGNDGGSQCTTASLAPGTLVRGAELRIDSTGKSWDKVELILQPTP